MDKRKRHKIIQLTNVKQIIDNTSLYWVINSLGADTALFIFNLPSQLYKQKVLHIVGAEIVKERVASGTVCKISVVFFHW